MMTEDRQPAEAGPQQTLTPEQDGPERVPPPRPRRRFMALAFLLLAVCAVMVPVLSANGGRNYQALAAYLGFPVQPPWLARVEPAATSAAPPPAAAPAPPDAVVPTPDILDPPSQLTPPTQAWQPEKSCREITPGVTGEKPVFLEVDGRWECTVLIVMDSTDEPGSLFVQARGAGTQLASLRMKLNFAGHSENQASADAGSPSGEADDALVTKATDLARRILSALHDSEISYIRSKMAAHQAFWTETGDYRMTFRQEMNDAPRFNFIVTADVGDRLPLTEGSDAPDKQDPTVDTKATAVGR